MNSQGGGRQKIFIGVSGGVDSSVALALLKEEGYDVTGVFLKVWHPDFLPCDWREERRSAMRVCATLGVPFLTLDCEAEYKKEVVDYMIREYAAGRVPNPDIFCNKYVKFGVFLDKALSMGADFIATGHYSRVTNQGPQGQTLGPGENPKVWPLEFEDLKYKTHNFRCSVRIRYRQEKQGCTVEKKKDGWHIVFDTPQSSVSLGQSAVLYQGEICLGGGIIDTVI